jgi:hypothetical protein
VAASGNGAMSATCGPTTACSVVALGRAALAEAGMKVRIRTGRLFGIGGTPSREDATDDCSGAIHSLDSGSVASLPDSKVLEQALGDCEAMSDRLTTRTPIAEKPTCGRITYSERTGPDFCTKKQGHAGKCGQGR